MLPALEYIRGIWDIFKEKRMKTKVKLDLSYLNMRKKILHKLGGEVIYKIQIFCKRSELKITHILPPQTQTLTHPQTQTLTQTQI